MLDAVADLFDLDLGFLLFRHARTDEDVLASRGDDERIGLRHPLICGLPAERLEGWMDPAFSRDKVGTIRGSWRTAAGFATAV